MNQLHVTASHWDAIVAIIFVVSAVFGWLAWNRYLYHKELMRLPDAGRDSREALRMKERWRMRQGLLSGAKLLALGVAIAVAMVIAGNRPTYVGRAVAGPGEMLLLISAAVFLVVIGLATIVAYAMWSRQDMDVLEEAASREESE